VQLHKGNRQLQVQLNNTQLEPDALHCDKQGIVDKIEVSKTRFTHMWMALKEQDQKIEDLALEEPLVSCKESTASSRTYQGAQAHNARVTSNLKIQHKVKGISTNDHH
jgi:hypothetical protein